MKLPDRRLLTLKGFLLVTLLTSRAPASMIEIQSGDPGILARPTCDSGPFGPARIVPRNPAWAVIPGTQWIQPAGDGSHMSCFTFQTEFELPPGYLSPELDLQIHVDDEVTVFLNGARIGEFIGFQNPPRRLRLDAPTGFRAGTNTLVFRAESGGGDFGINFKVVIDFESGDPERDRDADGMPDWWELHYGLDPDDASDASRDADGDFLVHRREYELGLDPRSRDSDADDLADGQEVRAGTDPLDPDTDGDTFPDGEEITWGSSPLHAWSTPFRQELTVGSGLQRVNAVNCSSPVGPPIQVAPVSSNSAWDNLPGAHWIDPLPDGLRDSCSLLQIRFQLPESRQRPELAITTYVDGDAIFLLNGESIGRHSGFRHPAGRLHSFDPRLFRSGENLLEIHFASDGGADGVNFLGVLRYLPRAGFRRGNPVDDGSVDLADAICILEAIFLLTCPLDCPDAADVNDDGSVNLTDAVALLTHLFLESGPLPAPGTLECGADPTPDDLDLTCRATGCLEEVP